MLFEATSAAQRAQKNISVSCRYVVWEFGCPGLELFGGFVHLSGLPRFSADLFAVSTECYNFCFIIIVIYYNILQDFWQRFEFEMLSSSTHTHAWLGIRINYFQGTEYYSAYSESNTVPDFTIFVYNAQLHMYMQFSLFWSYSLFFSFSIYWLPTLHLGCRLNRKRRQSSEYEAKKDIITWTAVQIYCKIRDN